MNILGVSGLHRSISFKRKELAELEPRCYRIAQGLDSGAALVTGEGIRAAAAEERFTLQKGTNTFPVNAIRYCLNAEGLDLKDLDFLAHAFCYEPYRLLFSQARGSFTGRQFDQVYSRQAQLEVLAEHLPGIRWEDRLLSVPHHLAHAASAFYVSGFEESLILVVDGMGELHSTTAAAGGKDGIVILKQIPAPHSLGILYSVLTLYLGFLPALDESKVMGLAPYGDPRRYFSRMMEVVHLNDAGLCSIPILLKNETLEEKETYRGTLRILGAMFGPRREPDSALLQRHCDLAAALQVVLQNTLMHMLRSLKKDTGLQYLCLAGGVALNCTANGVLRRSRLFRDIFVQPAAGDDGSALGAALYVQHQHMAHRKAARMKLPLWGPSYSNRQIQSLLESRRDCVYRYHARSDHLLEEVAEMLSKGKVVGWFQGRMEFGPRALGGRSILADPRDPGMRDRINALVKKRETFRPFAPAVPAEDAARFFAIVPGEESAYVHMLYTIPVQACFRDALPAVTHVDGSARVQTVFQEDLPKFWQLLRTFGNKTGIPVLLNTSFNGCGQPIVCTPEQALDTFLSTALDALAMEDYLVFSAQRGSDMEGMGDG